MQNWWWIILYFNARFEHNKRWPKKVEFVRENDSCDTNRALNVVTSLAQFHATFWNSPPDFIMPQNEPRLTLTGVAMKGSWNKFVSRLHDRLPQDILKRGLSLHKIALKIQDRLSTGPQTITHGDCHLENMFLSLANRPKMVLVLMIK